MNTKDYVMSILLYGFIGHLWILYTSHVFHITDEIGYGGLISGILIIIGFFLFGAIIKRLTPFNQYKSTHSVNLVGLASLLVVVAINIVVLKPF